MPPSGERSNRKGQYSCNFCRTRKLRCDRPLPCTSCRSRGKTCQFEPMPAALKDHEPNTPISIVNDLQQQQQPQQQIPLPSFTAEQVDLLAEIHALQRRTQDLEKRIIGTTPASQQWSPPASTPSSRHDSLPTPLGNIEQMGEVVGHL
jgi:hypothetical protein